MIEDMSPFAQRILAIGILLLALLLGFQLIAVPLIERMELSRNALADARYRLHKLENLESRPDIAKGQVIDPGLVVNAAGLKQAEAQLLGAFSHAASATSTNVQKIEAQPSQALASIVAAQIEVVGEEASIISFVEQLEAARPMLRLRDWRLEPEADKPGQLKLSAKLVASWEKRR